MGLLLLQGSAALNPRELFANGEQGLWLDPSQMSTMYQDSSGVTPCTAAGDPVGLIIDQSRGGLGALGSELCSNQTPSIQNSGTGTAGAYNSTTKTMTNSGSTAAGFPRFRFDVGMTSGRLYRIQGQLSGSLIETSLIRLALSGQANNVSYNNSTGVFSGVVFAGSSNIEFITELNGAESVTIASLSVREVPGNHAYQTTSASRPTLQTTGGLWYLSFDGSDDSLVTNAVNFTATDEMTVIAGVRKLSDAAVGMVAELTASLGGNNGSFAIFTPNTAAATTYSFGSKGTNAVIGDTSSGFAAPLTNVLTLQADISGDSVIGRINAAQVVSSTSDQGTGNYSNAIIYIGRRGGTTFPFNGHIYQLIIRGKTTPTGKLLEAERFVAAKTGVTGI